MAVSGIARDLPGFFLVETPVINARKKVLECV